MIRRLNHAVLWVSDLDRSVRFYTEQFGMTVAARLGGRAVFLRAADSTNDHDLGLFEVPAVSASPGSGPGLYHLAWQVGTIDDLASMRSALQAVGALTGESDHGVSKSLYGVDPDGIEFEVMWAVPRADWPETVYIHPLHLSEDLARWSGVDTSQQ